MPFVDDEPLPTGGCAPVDRPHSVAGHEVADVGVLDAVSLAPRDLAAREGLRLQRRQESAQRDRAGVGLEAEGFRRACLPGHEPERVAGAHADVSRLVDAPGRAPKDERQATLLAGAEAQATRCALVDHLHAGWKLDHELDAIHGPLGADGHDRLDLAPLERPFGVEGELGLDARVAAARPGDEH